VFSPKDFIVIEKLVEGIVYPKGYRIVWKRVDPLPDGTWKMLGEEESAQLVWNLKSCADINKAVA
jgi:hypothetical protein